MEIRDFINYLKDRNMLIISKELLDELYMGSKRESISTKDIVFDLGVSQRQFYNLLNKQTECKPLIYVKGGRGKANLYDYKSYLNWKRELINKNLIK